MGRGLFSLGKNQTPKPKNPLLTGFQAEGRLLPGSGSHPTGRPKTLHLATLPASAGSSPRLLLFPRKKNNKHNRADLRGKKPPPATACGAHVRGQPNYTHESALFLRVTHLTPTAEKGRRLTTPGRLTHTSEAGGSHCTCAGLLASTEPQAERLTLEE